MGFSVSVTLNIRVFLRMKHIRWFQKISTHLARRYRGTKNWLHSLSTCVPVFLWFLVKDLYCAVVERHLHCDTHFVESDNMNKFLPFSDSKYAFYVWFRFVPSLSGLGPAYSRYVTVVCLILLLIDGHWRPVIPTRVCHTQAGLS